MNFKTPISLTPLQWIWLYADILSIRMIREIDIKEENSYAIVIRSRNVDGNFVRFYDHDFHIEMDLGDFTYEVKGNWRDYTTPFDSQEVCFGIIDTLKKLFNDKSPMFGEMNINESWKQVTLY